MQIAKILCIFLIFVHGSTFAESRFYAVDGAVDLSHWSPENEPIINIGGDVAFYWQQFVQSQPANGEKAVYIKTPARWNIEAAFPEYGYGTY